MAKTRVMEKFIGIFKYVDTDGKLTIRKCECEIREEDGAITLFFRDFNRVFSSMERGIVNFNPYNNYNITYEPVGAESKAEVREYYFSPVNPTMTYTQDMIYNSIKMKLETTDTQKRLQHQIHMNDRKELFDEGHKDKRKERELTDASHHQKVQKNLGNNQWRDNFDM